MKKVLVRLAGGTGIAAVTLPVLAGLATAAEVGPGDRIRISDGDKAAVCSVSHAGHGSRGDYAFTAAHCGKPGAVVADAEGNRIGEVVYANNSYEDSADGADYAVIRLDDGVRVRNEAGPGNIGGPMPITGVDPAVGGVDFSHLGRPVVKDGATTGRTIGVQVASTQRSGYSVIVAAPGDSGGAVHDLGGNHVGTVSRAPVVAPVLLISSNAGNDIDEFNRVNGETYAVAGHGPRPAAPGPVLSVADPGPGSGWGEGVLTVPEAADAGVAAPAADAVAPVVDAADRVSGAAYDVAAPVMEAASPVVDAASSAAAPVTEAVAPVVAPVTEAAWSAADGVASAAGDMVVGGQETPGPVTVPDGVPAVVGALG